MRFIKLLSIISLLSALVACASINEDPTSGWSAERLYQEAKDALNDGNYEQAIENYTKLESRYPYGRYAQQAQLETIYAHYKAGETSSAVAAADRFIKFHPRHASVDYAYYLRGLATFDQNKGFLNKYFKQDPAARDPAGVRESFDYFKELMTRFPNSRYSPDALKRMTQLRNTLARHEVHAAAYYLKRGTYLAAANRAKYVLENYQRSTAIPDALVIMVKAYREMQLTDLATDAMRVLELNHPEHSGLAELKQQDSSIKQ
ncbi:MAG: outer membrane protein assembly factor BamD [Pseudomonadota bacterium]